MQRSRGEKASCTCCPQPASLSSLRIRLRHGPYLILTLPTHMRSSLWRGFPSNHSTSRYLAKCVYMTMQRSSRRRPEIHSAFRGWSRLRAVDNQLADYELGLKLGKVVICTEQVAQLSQLLTFFYTCSGPCRNSAALSKLERSRTQGGLT